MFMSITKRDTKIFVHIFRKKKMFVLKIPGWVKNMPGEIHSVPLVIHLTGKR